MERRGSVMHHDNSVLSPSEKAPFYSNNGTITENRETSL